jgi:hypothetical protein
MLAHWRNFKSASRLMEVLAHQRNVELAAEPAAMLARHWLA